MKVVLINCARTKKSYPCTAAEMWSEGRLFSKCLAYARSITDDEHIHIVTFAHGLMDLTDMVEPYDRPPSSFSKSDRWQGIMKTLTKLATRYDLENTEFVCLTTALYNEYLLAGLPHHETPLANLRMGDQLGWLSGDTSLASAQQGKTSIREDVIRIERKLDDILELLRRKYG